jgi:hypothetical protein
MLNEPTIEKLKGLRLDGLLAAWQEQQGDPTIGELGFDERLARIIHESAAECDLSGATSRESGTTVVQVGTGGTQDSEQGA